MSPRRMACEYARKVLFEAGLSGLGYDTEAFLSVFGVTHWYTSTAVPGTYRAGSYRNCVYSQDLWVAVVVLASVESPRPTEELLALASLLLCSGEAEFIVRWQPPGEGSP